MRFKRKQKRFIFILLALTIGLFSFFHWQNNSITTNEIEFKNSRIPKTFNNFKILHLSDLHNKEFGAKQDVLLKKIEQINPDIIIITGDLIDSNRPDLDIAMDLINGAMSIAPVYYVSGNHEAWSGLYQDLKTRLGTSGVVVLDNQTTKIFNKGDSINIIGLSDPSFAEVNQFEDDNFTGTENIINNLIEENNHFTILLSHRPERLDLFSNQDIDLVFSGHAHGGQIRLPFIEGLVAPNQGLFPQLTEGIHTKKNTSMVISRGLGNSIIPLRIFNRPELIIVTLSK